MPTNNNNWPESWMWNAVLILAMIGVGAIIYWIGTGISYLISNLEWVAQ